MIRYLKMRIRRTQHTDFVVCKEEIFKYFIFIWGLIRREVANNKQDKKKKSDSKS